MEGLDKLDENIRAYVLKCNTAVDTANKGLQDITKLIDDIQNSPGFTEIDKNRTQLALVTEQLKQAQDKISTLTQEKETHSQTSQGLTEHIRSLTTENNELTSKVSKLQAEINNLTITNNQHIDTIKSHEELIRRNSIEIQKLTTKLEEVNKSKQQVEGNITDLNNKILSLVQHVGSLQLNPDMFTQLLNDLKNKIASISSMITGTTQAPATGPSGGGRRRRRYTKKFRGGYTYHKTGKRNSAVVRKSKKRTSTRGYSKFSV